MSQMDITMTKNGWNIESYRLSFVLTICPLNVYIETNFQKIEKIFHFDPVSAQRERMRRSQQLNNVGLLKTLGEIPLNGPFRPAVT